MSETKLEVGGRKIPLSHPDKVLFPDGGRTKADLADYYARIGETALPHYRGRALSMQRFPDGIGKDGFFQKQASDHFPDWIRTAELPKSGGTVRHVVVEEVATLVYLADQAMITPHVSLSRVDRPDHPDRLVFDLDPPGKDFAMVQSAARKLRKMLKNKDIPNFVQTTGSRGMHVVVPLDRSAEFDRIREIARAIADRLAADHADELTVEQRKDKRGGRLYLDTGRNAYGQTAVAPYGVRALPGAPIATPLDWEEALSAKMSPGRYHIGNIFSRMARKRDPWADIDSQPVSADDLAQLMK